MGEASTAQKERKFVRYPVSLPCEFSSDPQSGQGEVVDLSTGGCKFESVRRFSPGQYLSMTLRVLSHDHHIVIQLGVVRWTSGDMVGVEFIRMSPAQQDRLRLLVCYIQTDISLWPKLEDGGAT